MEEKFKLSEKDIQRGIDDFFTELVIGATRGNGNRNKRQSLKELSSKYPKVIITVGQPGSGKTTLGKFKGEEYYKETGEIVVEVGSDKNARYHRDYNELLKLLPDECYRLSRQFVRAAEPNIYDEIRRNRISLIREQSLNKHEKDYEDLRKYKEAGYFVEIDVMAVDKYESFLSCIERDINLIELAYDPRPVARINHDRMYEPMLDELLEIENKGLADRINIYKRGIRPNQPILAYTSGDFKYSNPKEAVIAIRADSRRNIINNSLPYIARIDQAIAKLSLELKDGELKNNYLEELNNLKREFFKELHNESKYEMR